MEWSNRDSRQRVGVEQAEVMDLKLDALGTAASLAGIIMTLKRLYRLNLETPPEMAAVLSDIDVNEQQALTQIAARAHARRSGRTRQGQNAD